MTQKIIQIVPTENFFSITWNIGKRCNFDCMYCPTYLHDDISANKSFEELQTNWIKIFEATKQKNLKYKISFSGGEVTINKNFLPFLEWFTSNYQPYIGKILVTSNGSASYRYYSNLLKHIDNLSLSVHSEHVNEQKFFETVIKLQADYKNKKFIHVNLMNEFWNQERIKYYENICKKYHISYSVNEIDYSLKTREQPIMKGKLNFEIH